MPSRLELVAHGRTTAEVASVIGADVVIFQTLTDLVSSVRQFNPSITEFDCSVFTGQYVTGGVDESYLHRLEYLRANHEKCRTLAGDIEVAEGTGRIPKDIQEVTVSSSGPVNGADDTVGLYNNWKVCLPQFMCDASLIYILE
jgi:amidophosphoribosyltransferase